jgi:hypothetical protein
VQCDFWVSLTLWTKCSFDADDAKKFVDRSDFVATPLLNGRNEGWTPVDCRRAGIANFATPTKSAPVGLQV